MEEVLVLVCLQICVSVCGRVWGGGGVGGCGGVVCVGGVCVCVCVCLCVCGWVVVCDLLILSVQDMVMSRSPCSTPSHVCTGTRDLTGRGCVLQIPLCVSVSGSFRSGQM